MKRRADLPELLAPAGDFECLVAAVEAGADAVYVGGRLYSARAYAKNFDIEELDRAVSYCHLHGVKLYVTLNTLLYNNELQAAVEYADELWRIGVDALIVADLGLIRALREELPELELHASTQMSVHNVRGADVAASLGTSRVVLARELSLSDIKAVTAGCKPEVEIFLHGALCVCHSGQCLFSSLVGGRSGNRGECAQPCRLPYNGGKYPLSLKDLSLAAHVPALIDSGVASLKIEGRMKAPSYVYTVTSIYRKLLDERRSATAEEARELARAFSRDGFTDGYLTGRLNGPMTGTRSESDKAETRAISTESYTPTRVPVEASVAIRLGQPSSMTLTDKRSGRSVSVTGDAAAPARNAPLDATSVKDRLAKMGNTFLTLDPSDISLELDEGVNMSPSSINALRRSAAATFEISHREPVTIKELKIAKNSTRVPAKKHRTAIFYKISAYNAYKPDGYFDVIFLPLWQLFDGLCDRVPDGVALPPVIMQGEMADVCRMLERASEMGIKYALVGNLGQIGLAKEYNLTPIADFRLNVMNSLTKDALVELGLDEPMLSPELTVREAGDIGGREIVYGRIPLMLTERCFMRESFGCRSCSEVGLTDRRGFEFPMVREYEHRNLIFNSAVTYIADKPEQLSLFSDEHYIFTTESGEEIRAVCDAYKKGLKARTGVAIRRIGKRSSG